MAIPNVPLVTTVPVGYTPHNELHEDVNTTVNYIAAGGAGTAGLVLATPSAAPGAADFRAITAADIAAALKDVPVGAVGTPSIAFTGDPDSGLFWVAGNSIGVAAGGVMALNVLLNGTTREVNLGDGLAAVNDRINGAAATTRDITYASGGLSRFNFRVNNTAEGGANAGSDFVIISRDDAGAVLVNNIFSIKRSNGHISVGALASTTAPGRFNVIGTTDVVQEVIRANGTQTSDIAQWQASGGGVLVKLNGAGLFFPVPFTTAGRPAWGAGLVGALYFDTTANKLFVAGAAAWEQVTSV